MAQVTLSEATYARVAEEAKRAGFTSVDTYVESVLTDDGGGAFDPRTFFTPERLKELDERLERMKRGEFVTMEQLREEFRLRREAVPVGSKP